MNKITIKVQKIKQKIHNYATKQEAQLLHRNYMMIHII